MNFCDADSISPQIWQVAGIIKLSNDIFRFHFSSTIAAPAFDKNWGTESKTPFFSVL